MILRDILRTLERIEANQRLALRKLNERENKAGAGAGRNDEWVQKGIDAILGYQVGKKRGDVE